MILCIETATRVCSVALCDRNGIVAYRESTEGRSHASDLTPFIAELLKECSVKASDLEAVAVSKGPGSYTGLRIGVSTAKGLAFAAGIQLVAVNTLSSLCHGALEQNLGAERGEELLYVPMLDARRMEVYSAIFRKDGTMLRETMAEVITEDSFAEILKTNEVVFFGDGAAKCMGVISSPKATFYPDFNVSARYMHKPSVKAVSDGKFEDVAYFEPFYLKEFIATTPSRKIPGL